ncbi:hypothetical protein PQX77_012098 [Marasmius sp. AFHP31]|nr:hypothetical protein PQX77_012098 [Marasmius sp. AFHP31]
MPEARNPIVGFPDPFNNHGDRIVITFFYVLAIIFTLCRLGRRLRIHRFSWDDSWAAFALALLVAKMVLDWTRVGHDEKPRTEDDVAKFKSDMKLFFTLQTSLVSGIVWASRVSLALSVARIIPPGRLRTASICVAVGCFLFGTMLVILKCAVCRIKFTPAGPHPICIGGRVSIGIQTAGDVVASLILMFFPLYALRLASELPSHERRLIHALFASTILTLTACLCQAIFVIKTNRFAMTYSGSLETSISLMVCNLLVVVTFLYRLFSRQKEDGEYNSGEDIIALATVVRTGPENVSRAQTGSDISVQSDLTELGETQTYSLRTVDLCSSGRRTSGSH